MLFDFSENLDPNQVIFDSVDSSLSYLSKFIKFLTSHHNLLSNLIEYEEIPQKYLNSP